MILDAIFVSWIRFSIWRNGAALSIVVEGAVACPPEGAITSFVCTWKAA